MELTNLHKISKEIINETESMVKASLNSEETRLLLYHVPEAYKTQINDILLTALLLSYGDLTGCYSMYFNLEGHGREYIAENVDLSRTVGWFTSIFPVFLSLEISDDPSVSIKSVKEQLRQVPSHGIGFSILRFLSKGKEFFSDFNEPDIIFNYLGQLDNLPKKNGLLKNASESYGNCSHPKNKRSYPIEITAQIKDAVFEISWFFNLDDYDGKALEVFSSRYISRLRSLISHCTTSENFGYVPSDFPLAKLDQQKLDKVFGKIKKIEDIYPLSPLQSGLLFSALANTESDAYLVQTLYTFDGKIVSEILNLACQKINEHYSIFKTGFIWEDLEFPLQFIQKKTDLLWRIEDWHHLSPDEQSLKLKKLLEEDRQLKFDFKQPPLSRWCYIKISEFKSYLLWTHHHILLDGWSGAIILAQLKDVYQQLISNKIPRILYSSPYKEYIHYLEKHKDTYERFWVSYLEGMKLTDQLQSKLSLQEYSNNDYECYEFEFSRDDTDDIKLCSKNLQITLNTLIQGAWAILLSLYNQNDDVVFGVTVSGRNIDLENIENIVGLLINTLPLRVRVNKEKNLKEFLVELQQNMMQVNSMVGSSLARIKSFAKNQQHQDIFNNILIFENFPADLNFLNGSETFGLEKIQAFEKTEYPLSLTVNSSKNLSFNISYQPSYFDKKGIDKLASYFINILKQMQKNQDSELQDFMGLTENDKTQILKVWNNTDCEFPATVGLPFLYEEVVKRYPEKIAVRHLDRYLTYKELDQKANQFAHYLAKTGLVTRKPIGICLERSLDLVIAMLAVLKTGGYYVPLDPNHPQERLQYIVEDAEVKILITSPELTEKLNQPNCLIVHLDDFQEISVDKKIQSISENISADDTAYVIYTSGSTGMPKGVEISHRSLINLLNSMAKQPGITEKDCFLALTTIAFDISGLEIWLPLLNGAELVIAHKDINTDGNALGKLIEDANITLLQATPATWQLLLDSKWKFTRPLKLLSGGDVLTLELSTSLIKEGHQLWNLYGPTETTIWSTTAQISLNTIVSIGKPIDNTKVYILDKNHHLLPPGVSGELYIGGVGVAKGYLNREELNAERFIKDSFSSDEKARLYKTGDLVRYLEDGSVQYLGRIDDQIKIRGYRIEPGEIEMNIIKHKSIKLCAVIAKTDKQKHLSLVAYIVTHEETTETRHMEEKQANELRAYLRKKLPDYMIPSYFIILKQLPLNANGKVDRSQLSQLEVVARDENRSYVIPKTEIEKILSDIWRRILSVENISVHDNFFYLGGDSIIAINLVSQAKVAGVIFNIRQIFEFPTIHKLAKVAAIAYDEARSSILSYKTVAPESLAPIQKWFFENIQFIHHPIQSISLELNLEISLNDLKSFVQKLLQKYDLLRSVFTQNQDEKWSRGIQDIKDLCIIEYCSEKTLDVNNGNSIHDILQEEYELIQSSLNIQKGPLFKLVLINMGNGSKQKLVIAFHFLIIDSISWKLFFDSLGSSLQNNSHCTVEKEKSSDYADWLWKLNQYSCSQALENQLEYWCSNLSSSPSILAEDLSNNSIKVSGDFTKRKRIKGKLTPQETELLLYKVHSAYKTQMDDLLLTALMQAFYEINGHSSITVTLENHSRYNIDEQKNLFGIFGHFSCIFPLTLQLEAPNDLATSIKSMKEKLRAIPDEGGGYLVLKYLDEDLGELHRKIKSIEEPRKLFSYLGVLDNLCQDNSLFKIIDTDELSSGGTLAFDLVINCMVRDKIFELSIIYNEKYYEHHYINNLVQKFFEKLHLIIKHCTNIDNYGYVPSDFPLSCLKQEQLDQVFGKIKNIHNIYPLAPMQAAFVFMNFSQKTQEANFIQNLYEIKGNLDKNALKYAWQELFGQSEVLRTGFCYHSLLNQPLQYVSSNLELPWFTHDLQIDPAQDKQSKLSQLLQEDVSKGFALEAPPLVRLQLISFSDKTHYLIMSYHHIIMDGWSVPIFIRELKERYYAITSSLNKLAAKNSLVPYNHYIIWLMEQDEKKAKDFWYDNLQGFLTPSYLESGNQNLQHQTYQYKDLEFRLSSEETYRVVEFAKKSNVTLNTLMQVAWGLLLHHYTKKTDIIFGVTVSGRAINLPGIEEMIGLCINTMPLRIQILENDTLQNLLTRTQHFMFSIQDYSYLPLAKIRGLSELKSGLSLFNTILVFENYPKFNDSTGNIVMSLVSVMSKGEYPLGITIVPGEVLLFKFDYCVDNFNQNFIESLTINLKTILLSLVEDIEEQKNDQQ
jgi:amino acid adenylation domain-containing protein/non-ribosomal peptide synthase protein (TIGR01720 family)